ncbi:hypothetical protein SAMN05428948_1696 [Massilia sp. CF038]|nr:hypothetical protein SAMN05428948_1696 [Massilia sp. CF038]
MRSSSDPKEIGVSNGIMQAEILRSGFLNPSKYDDLMANLGSNLYWNHVDKIRSMVFDVQYAKLLPDAIRTDFLQFGPALISCPFLISTSAKNLLMQFNLSGLSLWPATVAKGRERFDYFLAYLSHVPDESIDFGKSVFFTGGMFLPKNFLKFSDANEKRQFVSKNYDLGYHSIYSGKGFDSSLDLFELSNAEVLVSSRLKNALEKAQLSGVHFLPAFGEEGEWLKLYC